MTDTTKITPSQPRAVILVMLGGALGTAARAGLTLTIPSLESVPLATALVNILGAFILGYLIERLTRHQRGSARARHTQLLLGTGFCGGFTTYSTLATDTITLVLTHRVGLAVAYAFGTLALGASATLGGILVASRRNKLAPTTNASPSDGTE
ncbi:fluoride efflux transporter CrcB [Klugiella xanthotipulae]|uniref:Fluoride-specific ion channel FluC n=1 Tax=Klugiella xanthotipulae TaxID=244735 RepID=A0A543HH44_9MICO|nr:CrcB family protein [Klugiella xanthotipulae]TQM57641.1 camphor resistance protein CrcB [Klugiella xanthotipulae]